MRPAGVKLTYHDYVLFPDDGQRHELIDGEHYVTPTPTTRHQAIVVNLTGMIWNYLQNIRSAGSSPRRSTSSSRITTSSSPTCCTSLTSGRVR
jgi:hypothetical protein